MGMVKRLVLPAALLICFALPGRAGITVGQIDTFEDGTTNNWIVGEVHPAPPANVSTGGPAGAGDNFMLLTAIGGRGPGSRMAVENESQWSGDYTAAGITSIAFDVNNMGASALALRLLIANGANDVFENMAITNAQSVAAGSGWTHLVYDIDTSHLTSLLGSTASALAGATEMRIYHSSAPIFPPPPVVTILGVDNITAGGRPPAVPEPSSAALLVPALAGLLARRRAIARAQAQ